MSLPKKQTKWYGWIPDHPDIRDLKYKAPQPVLQALPSSFDNEPLFPPVYNQLALGSCTAHMGSGIFQFNQLKEKIGWNVMPSRLFLYYNTRDIEGTIGSDAGASIRDTIKAMASAGMCPANYWPYVIANFADRPPQKCFDVGIKHTAIVYESVAQDINQIKAAIVSGEGVGIGFSVYDGFESADVARTGELNLPSANESLLGGHAVVVVGYDDSTQRVKIRNSWGESWGINGYFTMPYAYITNPDLASDFWVVRNVK